jgi:hypothetical protein
VARNPLSIPTTPQTPEDWQHRIWEALAWIIHERVATVVPERDRRVVFGGIGDAVIEV